MKYLYCLWLVLLLSECSKKEEPAPVCYVCTTKFTSIITGQPIKETTTTQETCSETAKSAILQLQNFSNVSPGNSSYSRTTCALK